MSLKSSQFRVYSHQASLWMDADQTPSLREVMALAAGPWANRFDGEPTFLPTGANLPPEFPRCSLSSSDSLWKLQIASTRLNLIWEDTPETGHAVPNGFASNAAEILAPYLTVHNGIRVCRLAHVVRRYAIHDKPGAALARHFCREEILAGPLNRPEDFELHAFKAYQPTRPLTLNSWIRWKTGVTARNNEASIVVEHDLNTLAEEMATASYDVRQINAFLDLTSREADQILRVYLGE